MYGKTLDDGLTLCYNEEALYDAFQAHKQLLKIELYIEHLVEVANTIDVIDEKVRNEAPTYQSSPIHDEQVETPAVDEEQIPSVQVHPPSVDASVVNEFPLAEKNSDEGEDDDGIEDDEMTKVNYFDEDFIKFGDSEEDNFSDLDSESDKCKDSGTDVELLSAKEVKQLGKGKRTKSTIQWILVESNTKEAGGQSHGAGSNKNVTTDVEREQVQQQPFVS